MLEPYQTSADNGTLPGTSKEVFFLAEQIPDTFLVYPAEMIVFSAFHQEKAILGPKIAHELNVQVFTLTLRTAINFNMVLHKPKNIFFVGIIFGDNKLVMAVSANSLKITG